MIALKPHGTRQLPRISVTKLGEYVGSRSAARRKTILTDQKHPKAFKTAIYNECFDPLVPSLLIPPTTRARFGRR
jgi:hypothetical protein